LPLITGNHPEYPSGHACVTAALVESLRNYFGTKHVPLVMTSLAPGAGGQRTYATLDELVEDVEGGVAPLERVLLAEEQGVRRVDELLALVRLQDGGVAGVEQLPQPGVRPAAAHEVL
jgi:hypothetical protein